jgi:periplasmic divalent cation tolerance protein
MGEYVQVLTTVSSEEEATKIGGDLLERRLVACVQTIGPITSRYRWRGKLEEEREWQLLAKTEAGSAPASGASDQQVASRAGGSRARRGVG